MAESGVKPEQVQDIIAGEFGAGRTPANEANGMIRILGHIIASGAPQPLLETSLMTPGP